MHALGNDRYAGAFAVEGLGRHVFAVRGLDRSLRHLARPARPPGRGRPGRAQRARDRRRHHPGGGGAAPPAAAARARPAGASACSQTTRGERAAAALDPALAQLMAAHDPRPHCVDSDLQVTVQVDPAAGPVRRLVRAVPALARRGDRARHAARRRAARSTDVAGMGFDVLYLPPIHPIGAHAPQGPEQHADRRRRATRAARGRSARAEGGHTAVHPELGTLDDFRRLVAAARDARHRDRARHRVPVLARPSLGARAPGVVPAPPRRHDPVRREPAEEVPGHLPVRLRDARTGAALWDGAARRRPRSGSSQGVRIFRVDNPHTKPFPFWEWLIGEVKREHPDVIFLAEAFTRPEGDVAAGQGRLHASRTPTSRGATRKQELDEYFTELTQTDVARVLPAELLAEHARHPHRAPADAAAGRRSSPRLVLAATLGAELRHLRSGVRARASSAACGAGQRGVPRLREVPAARTGTSTRPDSLRAADRAGQRRPPREPGAAANDAARASTQIDNDTLIAYTKRTADRRDVVLVVVNLDPHHTQSGWIDAAARARSASTPEQPLPGARPARRRALHVARARATTSSSIPTRLPAHIFHVRRAAAQRARLRVLRMTDADTVAEPAARPRPHGPTTRSGTRTRSSTSCTSARSTTATATASATSAG